MLGALPKGLTFHSRNFQLKNQVKIIKLKESEAEMAIKV
jgi:hypothetical protein